MPFTVPGKRSGLNTGSLWHDETALRGIRATELREGFQEQSVFSMKALTSSAGTMLVLQPIA
jgi:hypothetical protein